MARLKFSLHPLFYIFGLYFALTGKVFSFLVFTLSAVIHEIGHYIQSEKLGYGLKKIVLMPYGAIIKGEVSNLKYIDEIKISLAGPFINLIILILVVALWWVVPDTYPYTELIVTANLSLLLVNLLPCYPLDGGRALLATLSLFLSRKTAKKIVVILGIIFATFLLGVFIFSCFTSVNFTILFFSLFMFVGTLSKSKESEYIKIYNNFSCYKVKKPTIVKQIIVPNKTTIKELYSILNGEYYYEVIVENSSLVLHGENLYKLLTLASPYDLVLEAIKKHFNWSVFCLY